MYKYHLKMIINVPFKFSQRHNNLDDKKKNKSPIYVNIIFFNVRRIAGLDSTLAQRIVDFRAQHGGFISREQLKNIKGLGAKRFQQCAGFVRVLPQTRPDMDKDGISNDYVVKEGAAEAKGKWGSLDDDIHWNGQKSA